MPAAMKWLVLLLVAPYACVLAGAGKVGGGNPKSPIVRVVELMGNLKEKIRNDGELEQGSYDKYACWCEDTLSKKAADIAAAKESIDALQSEIVKLKGEIATHTADIAQLKKDIAANVESQREATEVRDKERADYEEDKTENEQCMGALEAAINVLHGAGGTGKKANLLATMQEAQLLSVVDGVRALLRNPAVTKSVSREDMQLVEKFVGRPEDFVGARSTGLPTAIHAGVVKPVSLKPGVFYPNELGGFLSAIQVGQTPNPYGDYAPQSDRISGILKTMYDTFARDLEKNNVEEADKQKAFEELMKTKIDEMKTLQATLDAQTIYEADKTRLLADTKVLLDNTKEQLEADEKFFAQAKKSCKEKAGEWAERVRMRTEELKGIDNAIELLSSEESKGIFENATSSFLQIGSASQTEDGAVRDTRKDAYSRLQSLATQFQNVKIAKIAVALTTSGHFDEVIVAIDKMITKLRAEEQEDIEHRDRCQNAGNDNAITSEDLTSDIDKLDSELKRSNDKKEELQGEIAATEEKMNQTSEEADELRAERVEAEGRFRQSVKDDTEAVALLGKAIEALSAYYKKNKMPIGLVQERSAARRIRRHAGLGPSPAPSEYSVDPEKAPETIWEEGEYKGSSSEAGGLVAILQMIQEDFEKEIETARKEDVKAQATYEEDMAGLNEILEKLTAMRNSLDKQLAELKLKIVSLEDTKGFKGTSLELENEKKETIEHDCAWVKAHFQSRREKRKAEMDGLVEAKNYLAGMESEMAGSDQ
jgi:peptidoglycan hydrolase CwlO-like protein